MLLMFLLKGFISSANMAVPSAEQFRTSTWMTAAQVGATLGLKHEELRKVLKKLPQIVSEGPLAEVVYLVVTNRQCNTSSTNLEIQQ